MLQIEQLKSLSATKALNSAELQETRVLYAWL